MSNNAVSTASGLVSLATAASVIAAADLSASTAKSSDVAALEDLLRTYVREGQTARAHAEAGVRVALAAKTVIHKCNDGIKEVLGHLVVVDRSAATRFLLELQCGQRGGVGAGPDPAPAPAPSAPQLLGAARCGGKAPCKSMRGARHGPYSREAHEAAANAAAMARRAAGEVA